MNMKHQDEELLSQYLDGELSALDASGLEQRLAAEPQLQKHFQNMQEINETLKSTFNTPLARMVPARIIRMLGKSDHHSGNVVPFPGRQRKASWGFAIAASIMAASGLLLVQGTGQQFTGPTPGSDTLLAEALENTPSHGDGWDILSDGRELRPLLTYAHIDGGWCREYLLLSRQNGHSRGIACKRAEGTWITEALDTQTQQVASPDEYRTAGAADSDQIAIFMENNAAGIALSTEQEQALIAKGWQ